MKKNDAGFICGNCGRAVAPLKVTSRNHCNYCLYSLHADGDEPGDRQSACRALMRPVSARPDAKKGYVITHKCIKCGAVKNNKYAPDDDINLIIGLTNSGAGI